MTVSHFASTLRLALLVVVPILGLIVNQRCVAQESSNSARKAVVICVHGVMANGNNDTYGKLKELSGFKDEASTLVVDFHWGSEWFFYASQGIGHRADQFSGISRYQWCAVAKLKNLVASLRRNGTIDASTKVSVLSHSQGTVVTLCALAEGMHLDNWVLMGSPLSEKVIRDKSNHTEFLKAAANVKGTIVNLNSPADDPAGLWNHIGRRGLPSGLTGKAPRNVSTTVRQLFDRC